MGSPLRHFLKPCDVRLAQSCFRLAAESARFFSSAADNKTVSFTITKLGYRKGRTRTEYRRTITPLRDRCSSTSSRSSHKPRKRYRRPTQTCIGRYAALPPRQRPSQSGHSLFRITIERQDHEVDQLCHRPPRMSQCQERSCPNGGHRIVTKRMALRSRL